MKPEQLPKVVAAVMLTAGPTLLLKPELATRALGLEGEEVAFRAIGVSDLSLVPGLLRGNPSTWMFARGAINPFLATWLHGKVAQSSKPGRVRAVAATIALLTVADVKTAIDLR